MIKITGLMDNYTGHYQCLAEHGLSYFIETPGFNMLFDTGASEKTVYNTSKLGVDIKTIKYILLSHGHYDHTGGLKSVLEEVHPVTIVAHPDIFLERFYKFEDDSIKKLSNPYSQEELEQLGGVLELTDEPFFFEQNIYSTGFVTRESPHTAYDNMIKVDNGKFLPDTIKDDQALIIVLNDQLNIITGCSHSGILNIVKQAIKMSGINIINYIIGGLHFHDTQEDKLKDILYDLNYYNIDNIAISHCTGINKFNVIQDNVACRLTYLGVGESILIQ